MIPVVSTGRGCLRVCGKQVLDVLFKYLARRGRTLFRGAQLHKLKKWLIRGGACWGFEQVIKSIGKQNCILLKEASCRGLSTWQFREWMNTLLLNDVSQEFTILIFKRLWLNVLARLILSMLLLHKFMNDSTIQYGSIKCGDSILSQSGIPQHKFSSDKRYLST